MEDAGAISFAYTGKMRPMETANGATLTQQVESRELCQVTCSFLDMNEPAMYPKPAHRELRQFLQGFPHWLSGKCKLLSLLFKAFNN